MTRACRRRPDRMPVAAGCGAWLALALILLGGPARPADPAPDLAEAERALREARVAVDGPGLLEFFRARTLSEAEQARLAATVRLLGDDEGVEEAVLEALPAVAAPGGKAAPALVKALADKEPLRRAAAARALGAVPGQRPAVRRLLDDAEPRVRYEAAAALVRAGDRLAVATPVALLGEGPETLAGQS